MAWHKRGAAGLIVLGLVLVGAQAQAQIAATNKISDVRGTKHNLSAAPDGSATPTGGTVPVRTVKATSETQVCVFCHTPHVATTGIVAPLWNRELSTALTYTPYTSNSLEAVAAELAAAPGGSSKLCLSCHDGTMAIDKVNVLNGAGGVTIPMTTASPVRMPSGNATTGFTRNLGVNLSSDHPISFTYSSTLATSDGELRGPDGTIVGNRVAGATKPKMPLENNQIQCATCHDPHVRDSTTSHGNAKFLRMNRFQVSQPTGGAFDSTSDMICLACHDKAGISWAFSAHANSQVATQTYKAAAAQQREFPSSLDTPAKPNPPVWQIGCLNCHDTHSVQGARRLAREGTDSLASPKSGGNSAIEETCYQCHASSSESAVTYTPGDPKAIPDIKTDFTTLTRRMPIRSSDQSAGTEVHEIGGVFNDGPNANCANTPTPIGNCGKDFMESRAKLGFGNLTNRHAECTDCHNPHRVIKGQDGLPGPLSSTNTNAKAGTHRHEDAIGYVHSNLISGVLRGSTGVEPVYPGNSFQSMPSSFTVKRGDPGASGPINPTVTPRPGAETYVTREYQICLKCHSNNGYTDDNLYPSGAARPLLGGAGLTPASATGRTNYTRYTNQAKEFQAPLTHAIAVGSQNLGSNGGAGPVVATAATNNNNHRSWHPVMAPTGRTGRAGTWLAPWNNAGALGTQTMYCSDCHGSDTTRAIGTTPTAMPVGNTATNENGNAWGPHGSNNDFLLKGVYSGTTGEGQAETGLCFKCHSYNSYADRGGGTGFQTGRGDGHTVHFDRIDTPIKCNWCHVAVPHGWKNRGLLLNLNDVGPEAGLAAGTSVGFTNNVGYTNGPYYRNAFLRIGSFPAAGAQWAESACNGGANNMKTNCETPP